MTEPEAEQTPEELPEQTAGPAPEAAARHPLTPALWPNSKTNWPKPSRRRPNTRMAGSAPWPISRTTGGGWRPRRPKPTRLRLAASSNATCPSWTIWSAPWQARPADLAWADGIELICRKLQSILEAEGLKRIEAEGQKFDPNFHEAIAQEPAEGVESGTVIAVVRNGYMLGERVIRPAMVRVAQ